MLYACTTATYKYPVLYVRTMPRQKAGSINVDATIGLTIPRTRGRPVELSLDVDAAKDLRAKLDKFISAVGGE